MPRILVIDDDADIRGLITDVLEAEDYEVITAEDGFAGLTLVETARPDCVVLDIMMPGINGHAVLNRIRGTSGPSLPVVMLTAAADDAQAWQAWTEGVDYFLAKPFDAHELLRFLDNLFAEQPVG